MSTLGPDYGLLTLEPMEPRIWLGGPSQNCWRMYFNTSLNRWELEGGRGLVLYTLSSTFDCAGMNEFDVLLHDHTLQAPSSVTVYPLSPLPCACPGMLEPERGILVLVPYAPAISTTIPLVSCGTHSPPAILTVTFSGFVGDAAVWNSFSFQLEWEVIFTNQWNLATATGTSPWGDPYFARVACFGGDMYFRLENYPFVSWTAGDTIVVITSESPFHSETTIAFSGGGHNTTPGTVVIE